MVGSDWHEAKAEWCDPDRPFDPSWNVPAKQSVQTEMPEWKLRAIYGDNVPRKQEQRPIGGHG